MESTVKLKGEIFKRLHDRSDEQSINLNDLANTLMENSLDYYDEEDRIFEQRTHETLEYVESKGIKGKPASEFLKEIESW